MDIFFIKSEMFSFFLVPHLHPRSPLFHPSSPSKLLWGCYPTHPSTLTSQLWHSSTLGTKPSQDQGPLLPLMPDKAILWDICGWCHGSCHVNSLVADLIPESSRAGVWLVDIVVLSIGLPTYIKSPFSNSSIGDPILSPIVGWEHPPLYLSDSGKASQETTISVSCQHALLASTIVSAFDDYMG